MSYSKKVLKDKKVNINEGLARRKVLLCSGESILQKTLCKHEDKHYFVILSKIKGAKSENYNLKR